MAGATVMKDQIGYVLRRVGLAMVVLWAAFTLTFLILYALPGDPGAIMLAASSSTGQVDPVALAEINARYGFDQPIVVQYWNTLVGMLSGDLGSSHRTGRSVSDMLGQAILNTLPLALLALAFTVVIGFAIGTLSVAARNRWFAGALAALPPLGASLPAFWVGLLFIQFFSFSLGWFPAAGNNGFRTLVLPAFVMAIPASASVAQLVAQGLNAALGQPYAEIARAKGASETRVFLAHALRNALLPVVTVLGLITAVLIGSATIAETVFSRAGLGSLMHQGVLFKDLPVVLAVTVVVSFVYVTVNLVIDLFYPLIDPRISLTAPRRIRQSAPEGSA